MDLKITKILEFKPMLKECRLCKNPNVEKICNFESMPIHLWPSESSLTNIDFCDLESYLCKLCGHLQIQNLSSEFINNLYSRPYLNLPSPEVNHKRLDILQRFINFDQAINILDVGGGTNPSYEYYKNQEYTILDPIVPDGFLGHHIQEFLSDARLEQDSFDLILAFHILEHLEKPVEDLTKLVISLKKQGKIVVEVPDRKYYINKIPFYLYFHQHINLFDKASLEFLLDSVGLQKIKTIELNGRILAIFEKKSPVNKAHFVQTNNWKDVYKINKEFFLEFDDAICQSILKFKSNEIILLGAGGSSTLLLYHCPKLKGLITKIVDSDDRKIGKICPNTEFAITSPNEIFSKDVLFVTIGLDILNTYENIKNSNFVNVLDFIG